MSFPRKRESRTNNVLGARLRGGDGYLVGSAQNRESRGRRPRLSAKEEKKRFRPSGGQHTPRVGGLAWRAPDARPTESLRRAGPARPGNTSLVLRSFDRGASRKLRVSGKLTTDARMARLPGRRDAHLLAPSRSPHPAAGRPHPRLWLVGGARRTGRLVGGSVHRPAELRGGAGSPRRRSGKSPLPGGRRSVDRVGGLLAVPRRR